MPMDAIDIATSAPPRTRGGAGRRRWRRGAAAGAGGDAPFFARVQGGDPPAKRDQSLSLVAMLATETATGDDGPGGKMRESDTALRDVLMLSSLATGAKHVHTALAKQGGVGSGNRNPGMGSVFRHQTASAGTSLAM